MDACEDFRPSLRLGLYDDFVTEAINSPEYYEINRNICVKQHFKNHVNKNRLKLFKEFDEYAEHYSDKNVQ